MTTLGEPLATVDDLAVYLGMTPERVQKLTVTRGWPCVWVSKRVVRYTPEHVAAIVASCTRCEPATVPVPTATAHFTVDDSGITQHVGNDDCSLNLTAPFGHRSRRKRAN